MLLVPRRPSGCSQACRPAGWHRCRRARPARRIPDATRPVLTPSQASPVGRAEGRSGRGRLRSKAQFWEEPDRPARNALSHASAGVSPTTAAWTASGRGACRSERGGAAGESRRLRGDHAQVLASSAWASVAAQVRGRRSCERVATPTWPPVARTASGSRTSSWATSPRRPTPRLKSYWNESWGQRLNSQITLAHAT
jgi:hypothetical protein